MNILLINHYAGNPEMGMEYRPYYMAREWRNMGHSVRIVCSSFSHLRYFNPILKTSIFIETIENVEFCWIKTPKYIGNGIQRVNNIIVFLIKLILYRKRIVTSFKPDIVISSSTYPLDGVLVRWFMINKEVVHVHEIHDLWPLTLKLLGGYRSFNPFIALLQWSENFVLKNCDYLVSILPGTFPYLISHGLAEEKFIFIPNGFIELQQVIDIPKEHSELLNRLKAQGKFILLYAGGHNISNALHFMVLAAEKISDPDIAIVFVGKGTEKQSLIKMAEDKMLKNIFFLPPVSKNAIPELLKFSDCLYLGWSKSPLYEFGISPNKIFDYMIASKPIIHSYSGSYDIVKSSGCGITVQAENHEEIVRAIFEMKKKNPEELISLGRLGYQYVIRENNYKILSDRFINLLK